MSTVQNIRKSVSLGISAILVSSFLLTGQAGSATAQGKGDIQGKESVTGVQESSSQYIDGSQSVVQQQEKQSDVSQVTGTKATELTVEPSQETVTTDVYVQARTDSEKRTLNMLANVEKLRVEKRRLPNADAVKELPERRTANSKHYLMKDGSYQAVISMQDEHFIDENGELQDIVPFLINESDLHMFNGKVSKESAPKVNQLMNVSRNQREITTAVDKSNHYIAPQVPYDVNIPKYFNSGYSIEKNGLKLEFIPENSLNVTGEVYGTNGIVYYDAWQKTDVLLQVEENSLKESIILKNEEAPKSFTYELRGLNPNELYAGDLMIQPAWLKDANGQKRDVAQDIRVEGDTAFIDITANVDGLSYPILIDPTIIVKPENAAKAKDTWVSSSQENWYRDQSSSTELLCGFIYRSYLQFDLSSISGKDVTGASLHLYNKGVSYLDMTAQIYANPVLADWNENIGWMRQPPFDSNISTPLSSMYVPTIGWFNLDMTDLVKQWNNNVRPNYGFVLIGKQEVVNNPHLRFVSSDDSNSALWPYISIEYNEAPSAVQILTPNGGEKLDQNYTITWRASSDSTQPQSQLRYKIELSTNGGTSWTQLGMTEQGITSFNYDFSTVPPTSSGYIRVTTFDGSLWGEPDQSDAPFTIQHNRAPNTPVNLNGQANAASAAPVAGTTPVIKWSFSDPDTGDKQSAFKVIVINSGGTIIHDSGWVTSNSDSYTVPVSASLIRGGTYSYQVQVKDIKGAASGLSAKTYFKINTLPVSAITSFTDGQVLTDNVLGFTWSFVDGEGQNQSHYQVIGSKDNWATWAYNSGEVASANRTHQTPALSDGTWSFAVRVKDGLEWSNWVYCNNLKLPNAYEPNDTSATATNIGLGVTYNSAISTAADVDWYKYKATANGIDQVSFSMPADKNYDVYIYDANLKLIGLGGRMGNGEAEEVIYKVTGGSTYYIQVVGVGGQFSTASYSFTVTSLQLKTNTTYQYDSNGNITGKTTTLVP